jgi:tetratricopeptide (TPR) repeat protein
LEKEGADEDPASWEPYYLTRQRIVILNELALQARERRDYAQAISILTHAVNLNGAFARREGHSSQDGRLLLNRGDCYRELGGEDGRERAAHDYQIAAAQTSDPKEAWSISTRMSMLSFGKGTALFNAGNFVSAAAEFSAAIKHNWKISAYFLARGKCMYLMDNHKAAFNDFQKALETNPDDEEAKSMLAQIKSNRQQQPGRGKSTSFPTLAPAKKAAHRGGKCKSSLVSRREGSQPLRPLGVMQEPACPAKDWTWSMMRREGKRWG